MEIKVVVDFSDDVKELIGGVLTAVKKSEPTAKVETQPKEEKKTETQPVKEEKTETQLDLKKEATTLARDLTKEDKSKRPIIKSILNDEFSASRIGDLDPECYSTFIERLKEL